MLTSYARERSTRDVDAWVEPILRDVCKCCICWLSITIEFRVEASQPTRCYG